MVKGTVAVPKPELLLNTQSVEGAWLQGSGWQGSLLCWGTPIQQEGQLPTLQGSPVPCKPPKHCGAGNRELGTLTEFILAHVPTERGWAGSSQGHAEVTHCLAQRDFSHLAWPGEGI